MNQEPPRFIAHIRKHDVVDQPLESHLYEVGDITGKFSIKFGVAEARQLIGLIHYFGEDVFHE